MPGGSEGRRWPHRSCPPLIAYRCSYSNSLASERGVPQRMMQMEIVRFLRGTYPQQPRGRGYGISQSSENGEDRAETARSEYRVGPATVVSTRPWSWGIYRRDLGARECQWFPTIGVLVVRDCVCWGPGQSAWGCVRAVGYWQFDREREAAAGVVAFGPR